MDLSAAVKGFEVLTHAQDNDTNDTSIGTGTGNGYQVLTINYWLLLTIDY